MTPIEAPPWLETMQAAFTSVIRTPLDQSSGSFRTAAQSYDESLCCEIISRDFKSAARGLGIYNCQYWFRLFSVMQKEYPLVARLLGYWRFNGVVMRWLLAKPPQHLSLSEVASSFIEHLSAQISTGDGEVANVFATLPSKALIEAARIDHEWSRVFLAPLRPTWVPTHQSQESLLACKLSISEAIGFVEQSWPLLRMRDVLRDDEGEGALSLPIAFEKAQHWIILRTERGIGQIQVSFQQRRFYQLLIDHPVGEALAIIEAEYHAMKPEELAERVQSWLRQSVELGFWTGARNCSTSITC